MATADEIRNPLDARRRGWDRNEYGDGGFESGVFTNREPAWHGLGEVVDDPDLAWHDAIRLGGLDWRVERWDVAAINPDTNELVKADRRQAIVRETDKRVLGVVGPDYRPIQNHELGELGDAILDSGDVRCVSAVSLKNGSRVALVMKLGDDIRIDGWDDETIEPYLLCTNSHDGTMALTIAVTPIRVVCTNTLRLALQGTERAWKVRHTVNYAGKLDEARRALGLTYTYLREFETVASELLAQPMTDREFQRFLDRLAPKVSDDPESRKSKNRDEKLTVIRGLWASSPNLENVRGTRWAALNAVAEYSDWMSTARNGQEGRFVRTMETTDLKDRALALLR